MFLDFCKTKLVLIIYIFLLLFAPPFIKSINMLLILSVFSAVCIVVKYRKNVKDILKLDVIKRLGILVFIYIGYYILTILINGVVTGKWHIYNYVINCYSMMLVGVFLLICALHIVLFCKDKNISLNDIIGLTIWAGLIQFLISFFALVIPEFKTFLINIMYKNTGDNIYIQEWFTQRRFYGFANNLLDSFGFGMGILSVLPLFYSIRNGKKWLLASPLLLVSVILNSRTGLVVYALGVIVWFIYIIASKKIKQYFDILCVIMAMLLFAYLLIKEVAPSTIYWIRDDMLSFVSSKFGTADMLFGNDSWRLPGFWNTVFGVSINVAAFGGLSSVLGFTSDVGYINEIWKTGLIGVFLTIFILLFTCGKTLKKSTKEYKYFMIFFILACLVSNIKFNVISYNPGMACFMLYAVYVLYEGYKKQNVNDCPDLISIIVPVYNVENYLERALNSIGSQTYANIEIILVNDGSTDGSEKICLKFANEDARIKYVYQENMGLSAARNAGILLSTGKYITFIDSDDYINANFINELYHTLKTSSADISVCEYTKVYEKLVNMNYDEVGIVKTYKGKSKYLNMYNDKSDITIVAWNKLYKREIFDKIRYPVGKINEDQYIIYEVLSKAEKVAYTSVPYYYYYQRSNSIMGTYNLKRLHILDAYSKRMEEHKTNGEKRLYSFALYNYYYQLIEQTIRVQAAYPNEKEIIQDLLIKIKQNRKKVYLDINVNILKKIKLLLKEVKNRGILNVEK